MTFCQCVCVRVHVCVCVCGSPDAYYFSVDTQRLGRRTSIQDLGRKASCFGHRPTLDPRKGYQVVQGSRPSKGKYQKHGLGRKIPKDIWRPALSQVVRA